MGTDHSDQYAWYQPSAGRHLDDLPIHEPGLDRHRVTPRRRTDDLRLVAELIRDTEERRHVLGRRDHDHATPPVEGGIALTVGDERAIARHFRVALCQPKHLWRLRKGVQNRTNPIGKMHRQPTDETAPSDVQRVEAGAGTLRKAGLVVPAVHVGKVPREAARRRSAAPCEIECPIVLQHAKQTIIPQALDQLGQPGTAVAAEALLAEGDDGHARLDFERIRSPPSQPAHGCSPIQDQLTLAGDLECTGDAWPHDRGLPCQEDDAGLLESLTRTAHDSLGELVVLTGQLLDVDDAQHLDRQTTIAGDVVGVHGDHLPGQPLEALRIEGDRVDAWLGTSTICRGDLDDRTVHHPLKDVRRPHRSGSGSEVVTRGGDHPC